MPGGQRGVVGGGEVPVVLDAGQAEDELARDLAGADGDDEGCGGREEGLPGVHAAAHPASLAPPPPPINWMHQLGEPNSPRVPGRWLDPAELSKRLGAL